jgi:hypothetical protein
VTATITQVKTGLAARLATITGLRTYAYQPDQLNAPMAYSNLNTITYHRTFGGMTEQEYTVTVIVARATERTAEASVDGYTAYEGTTSVRAAIEADRTLGGVVDDLIVESATGIQSVSANDTEYLSVDFVVRVYS